MALIPEFQGSVDELEQFVRIVDRVHDRKIVEEDELLDIVLSKLRGEAVGHCHRLNAETWDDLKDQLSTEFGVRYTVETIFHRTEALCQRPHETFKKYRDRARKIVEMVIAYAPDNESLLEYASRHIKDHFVTGLNDPNLKVLALMQNELKLDALMTYLEEVHENSDRVEEATRRLRAAQAPQAPFNDSGNLNMWSSNSYNGGHKNPMGWPDPRSHVEIRWPQYPQGWQQNSWPQNYQGQNFDGWPPNETGLQINKVEVGRNRSIRDIEEVTIIEIRDHRDLT
ncbi:hypothetical protein ZHAS_00020660 [Anopheles sinensis]|uniref:Retrotransposon gag domain-containing protein n=1 Tax=Anopheles sinensis TaxID=74873 RepID=A0A084WQC7_ANOSI|nr:hypothetical protein ZHAS_00020660 [Anopheles sinensis]